ncbi:hypothetical protein BGZ54_005114 [Gamsiella multidivaricata]|nr:hypothetical protein BGZ54_005114 [Gamsiella multidivaricata]
MSPPSQQTALHVYVDFDSTVVLQDTGNTLLAHELGEQELDRLDRLPETQPGDVSFRKAEEMKWERLHLTIKEAADILIDPNADVLNPERNTSRVPFDEENGGPKQSYYVQLDPGFKEFHRYCREHAIPITVISIGILPLIQEMLDRFLGVDHGIEIRANGLTFREDGSWRVLWRDSR